MTAKDIRKRHTQNNLKKRKAKKTGVRAFSEKITTAKNKAKGNLSYRQRDRQTYLHPY